VELVCGKEEKMKILKDYLPNSLLCKCYVLWYFKSRSRWNLR